MLGTQHNEIVGELDIDHHSDRRNRDWRTAPGHRATKDLLWGSTGARPRGWIDPRGQLSPARGEIEATGDLRAALFGRARRQRTRGPAGRLLGRVNSNDDSSFGLRPGVGVWLAVAWIAGGIGHGYTTSAVWPGLSTEIDPPQLHMSLQVVSTAGDDPLRTVGMPGIHGEVVIGTQGIGVSTPNAAAVAAATVGFANEVQAPNGGILATGAKHELFADGTAGVSICPLGITTRLEGAAPKVHIIVAPMQTAVAIAAF